MNSLRQMAKRRPKLTVDVPDAVGPVVRVGRAAAGVVDVMGVGPVARVVAVVVDVGRVGPVVVGRVVVRGRGGRM